MNQQPQEYEIDLLQLLQMYLKRWYLIIIAAIVGAAVAFSVAYFYVEDLYKASVTLYVNNSTTQDDEMSDSIDSGTLSTSARLVSTYINIVTSNTVMSEVADELGDGYTYQYLESVTSASQVGDTEIFEVSVITSDKLESVKIANAIGEIAPKEIAEIINGSSAWLIDTAEIPDSRYSPSYTKFATIGALIGAVLVCLIITLVYLLDVTIRNADDLERVSDLPILGTIPEFKDGQGNGYYGHYGKHGYYSSRSKKGQYGYSAVQQVQEDKKEKTEEPDRKSRKENREKENPQDEELVDFEVNIWGGG